MAGPSIGSIRGTIEIDYDGKGIIRAQDDVDKLDKKSLSSEASLNKVAKGLALFGGVVAAGFAVAANSAVSFEKQMSAIKAVSGATAAEMDLLSKKALQLGADTKFSASEAGLAMEELVKAGLSVEEVLNGAADATVNLAAAGEVDLPFAATIAANALNQFNLKASDLTKVVDNIAGAANASAIDVQEFGFSLSQVGAVAHLAGQSFEDTATAIALMGNAGIKGSDAGTSLKTFLNNLIPTTDRAKQTFKDLGLAVGASGNAFIDAQGNYKSLGDIAGVLHTATAGLTESQKTLALETLFGSDAIRAAAVIANAGADGFANLNAEMNKTTAAEVAATRLDNTAGSIEQLKGSLETLAISIGTTLLPSLNKIVDGVQSVVDWFSNLDKGTQKTIVGVVGVAGALALTTAAAVKLIQAIKAIQVAVAIAKAWSIWANLAKVATAAWAAIQWVLAAAMNATFLIVILVIAIIGALIAGIILLWKHNETFRKVVTAVWEAVKKAIKAAVDWIVDTAWPWIKKAFEGIVDVAKWLWGWIVKIFKAIVEGVKFEIGILIAIWNFIAPAVKAAFGLVVSIIKTAWTIISAIFSVIVTVVKAVFSLWWTITSTVMNAILDVIKAVWGFISPFIIGAIKAWWDYVQFVWNALVAITTTVFNFVKDIIMGVWSVIGPFVIGAAKMVWDFLVKAWDAISTATQFVWTGIKDFLGTIWDGIVAIFTFARDRVVAVIDGIKVIVDKIRNFFSELKAAADKGVGPLIDFVKTIPGKIFGALGDLGGMLFDSGKKMIQGLVNGINSMVQKAKDSLSNLLGALRKLLPFSPAKEGPFSGKGWTFNSGTALIEDFAKGIDKASSVSFDAALGAVSGVASSFPTSAGNTAGTTAPASSTNVGGSVNIGSLNLNGVWDFNDPMATRKIVGQLDRELTLYQNGFK
jgi:TP901 family phage tail tape measure protein